MDGINLADGFGYSVAIGGGMSWWQLLEPIEWDYCCAVDWEMFPSGCVVVYE